MKHENSTKPTFDELSNVQTIDVKMRSSSFKLIKVEFDCVGLMR